jgi:hypothetical protein
MPDKVFSNYVAAEEWMLEQVDDSCVDNYRFAYLDDPLQMQAYGLAQESGCCGFFDEEVIVNERRATIGCNYGH